MKTLLRNKSVCLLSALIILIMGSFGLPAGASAPEENAAADTSTVENEDGGSIPIERWLLLGPVFSPFPAFHQEDETDNDGAFLLSYKDIKIEDLDPEEGRIEGMLEEGRNRWVAIEGESTGASIPAAEKIPQIAYLAAYIEVPRWMKVKVEARGTDPFEIYIDGKSVVSSKKGTGKGTPCEFQKGDIKLEKGKHLLIAKTVYLPADSLLGWCLDARIAGGGELEENPLVTLDP
ncbi:MAG: hypothetical protein JXB45_04315, partial [Candidatus Krumholzibacteriota bacterium]|nr:hypothetical protein [Candidatus Krumholzibacteriota bacterium]